MYFVPMPMRIVHPSKWKHSRIKKKLSDAALKDFNSSLPIRDILKGLWYNMFNYISLHREYFKFAEQFSNSPYNELVNKEEVEKYFEPMSRVLV